MSRQNKVKRKLWVARNFSDIRVAQRQEEARREAERLALIARQEAERLAMAAA